MAQDSLVLHQEAEEGDLVGVVEPAGLSAQALCLGPVADDAQGGVVLGGDGVEGLQEDVDVPRSWD